MDRRTSPALPSSLAFPRSSVRIDGERDGPKSAAGTVLNENSEGLKKKKVFIVKVLLDPFWSQLQRGAADLRLRLCPECCATLRFAVQLACE